MAWDTHYFWRHSSKHVHYSLKFQTIEEFQIRFKNMSYFHNCVRLFIENFNESTR